MKARKATGFRSVGPSGDPASPEKPGTAHDAIVVLTADRRDDLIAKGGSGDWVLNPDKASRCRYLVCCRKERWDNRGDGIEGRSAFLVGTIDKLLQAEGPANTRNQHRYFIALRNTVLVTVPNVWDPTGRNPVAYASLGALGLDASSLTFEPIESTRSQPQQAPRAAGRMSIAEAKRALAESFGVRPEDIEINIRG